MELINNTPNRKEEISQIKEQLRSLWQIGEHEKVVDEIKNFFKNDPSKNEKLIDYYTELALQKNEIEIARDLLSVVSERLDADQRRFLEGEGIKFEKRKQLQPAWEIYQKLGNQEKVAEIEERAKDEYGVPFQYVEWGWKGYEKNDIYFSGNNFWSYIAYEGLSSDSMIEIEQSRGNFEEAARYKKDGEIFKEWIRDKKHLVDAAQNYEKIRNLYTENFKDEKLKTDRIDAWRNLLPSLETAYRELANLGIRPISLCG